MRMPGCMAGDRIDNFLIFNMIFFRSQKRPQLGVEKTDSPVLLLTHSDDTSHTF